jgi:hypothetical protein
VTALPKKTVKDEKKVQSKSVEKDKEKSSGSKNEKKTIVVEATDIESLVLHSVSELLDKGVLEETEDGHKIDLKKDIEAEKKKKKRSKEEGEEEEEK